MTVNSDNKTYYCVENLPDISFSLWCHIARMRPELMLRDGTVGTLVSIDRMSYTAKVRISGKHFTIHYDDMWAFKIVDPLDGSVSSWTMLPSWSVLGEPLERSYLPIEPLLVEQLVPRKVYPNRRQAILGLGPSFRESF